MIETAAQRKVWERAGTVAAKRRMMLVRLGALCVAEEDTPQNRRKWHNLAKRKRRKHRRKTRTKSA